MGRGLFFSKNNAPDDLNAVPGPCIREGDEINGLPGAVMRFCEYMSVFISNNMQLFYSSCVLLVTGRCPNPAKYLPGE
jgi:hypothetical protein